MLTKSEKPMDSELGLDQTYDYVVYLGSIDFSGYIEGNLVPHFTLFLVLSAARGGQLRGARVQDSNPSFKLVQQRRWLPLVAPEGCPQRAKATLQHLARESARCVPSLGAFGRALRMQNKAKWGTRGCSQSTNSIRFEDWISNVSYMEYVSLSRLPTAASPVVLITDFKPVCQLGPRWNIQ